MKDFVTLDEIREIAKKHKYNVEVTDADRYVEEVTTIAARLLHILSRDGLPPDETDIAYYLESRLKTADVCQRYIIKESQHTQSAQQGFVSEMSKVKYRMVKERLLTKKTSAPKP